MSFIASLIDMFLFVLSRTWFFIILWFIMYKINNHDEGDFNSDWLEYEYWEWENIYDRN